MENNFLFTPVTMYENSTAKIGTKTTLQALLKSIEQPTPTEATQTQKIRNIYTENPLQYQKQKAATKAFSIGDFSVRKDDKIKEYIPLLVFDIDHIKDDFTLSLYIGELKTISYVFAAFPSLSGRGIRFFAWTHSTKATHKDYYKAIATAIGDRLNISIGKDDLKECIDLSTSNISRIWYVSHALKNEFYVNWSSDFFKIEPSETHKKVVTVIPQQPKEHKNNITFSDNDVIGFCERIATERNGTAASVGRNNYVFALSSLLKEHNISFNTSLQYLQKYSEKDFTDSEIKATAKSAYDRTTVKYNASQIAAYLKNGNDHSPNDTKKTINEKADANKPFYYDSDANRVSEIIRYLERYDIRMNIVTNLLEYAPTGKKDFKILNENDLMLELRLVGMKGLKDDLNAFFGSSMVKEYDPFLHYFEGLQTWTGESDHIEKIANYVTASDDQDFFNTMFKKHLVRAVACALHEKVFNKHCFTLVGKQNDGKSTFVRFLCPTVLQEYFKDGIRFENKDADIALTENLIINLDELATFSKQDINRIKEVFSKEKVKARRPFAKREITMTRRASFFASTNDDEFLTDTTGNVRWLVFNIESINHDGGGRNGYQSVNINEVWAQAFTLYKQGFKYQLTKEELERSEEKNKSHMVDTFEMQLLRATYKAATKEKYDAFMTTGEIKQKMELENKGNILLPNIGKALTFLGFKKGNERRKEKENMPYKGYYVNFIEKQL